ncbi:MAG TPA: ADP-glyceromanno-heptose 6-epimerase [Chitinophagaceae bacterium]|nr:ADP-glyceromanno-heptose 6-epimerase [Chitinophagaceae bacterium]
MDNKAVIIVTGAAGFIGSCMVGYLNRKGYEDLILVDEFDDEDKELNLHGKKYRVRVERDNLFEWLENENPPVAFVFHLGARTDTTEFDYSIHERLNVEYSKKIWEYCSEKNIPLVYASSAATYGSGELGYTDSHEIVDKLQPLNPYGVSKNEFDKWALFESEKSNVKSEKAAPPFWAGLKFFNVYGPNEYHKARMASVIFHSFNQVREKGKVRLFRSHRPDFKDGEQLRDFIYVNDVVAVCYWFMEQVGNGTAKSKIEPGLYNLGTGKARSFNDLVKAIFVALDKKENIEYIDTPLDIRDKYQYFTEADMNKLRNAGYPGNFHTLEDGVGDYVKNFLESNSYY